jgi:hypothetical protein
MADLAIVGIGAFLVLVALIWKAYRVIDERLSEIQADIGELHNGVSHLFLLASKSENASSKPDPHGAPDNAGKVAHKTDDLALLRSPGLESELAEVDELCAKLITLVPPAKGVPLISAVPKATAAQPISEMNAERPGSSKAATLSGLANAGPRPRPLMPWPADMGTRGTRNGPSR